MFRTLWCRLGAQLSVDSKPVFFCASTSLFQSVPPRSHKSKPRAYSNCFGPWIFSRTCYLNTNHQLHNHVKHVETASAEFSSLSSVLTGPGMLATCRSGQKCLHSSSLVKSMLKPSLKPPAVSGKRVPKGPRTKQPSRTNQPAMNEDKVLHPMSD